MAENLLERVARGDTDAVAECLARYGGLVWALARRHAADPADAEDAAQEVFIDLWRHAARFDPAIAPEATFVTMIARRRLIDRIRKRSRALPAGPLGEGPADPSPAVEQVELADEAASVRRQMAFLRPQERRVLEMSVEGGLSQTEIASALGMPLGTVKAHARRGLLRLRELVAGLAPEGAGP